MNTIARGGPGVWKLFGPHLPLMPEPGADAACYVLAAAGRPASFAAIRRHQGRGSVWYVARAVTLPRYRGRGLWFELKDTLASALKACGQTLQIHPTDSRLIGADDRSEVWQRVESPGLIANLSGAGRGTRAVQTMPLPGAVFEYVGPAMEDVGAARALLAIPSLASDT